MLLRQHAGGDHIFNSVAPNVARQAYADITQAVFPVQHTGEGHDGIRIVQNAGTNPACYKADGIERCALQLDHLPAGRDVYKRQLLLYWC